MTRQDSKNDGRAEQNRPLKFRANLNFFPIAASAADLAIVHQLLELGETVLIGITETVFVHSLID